MKKIVFICVLLTVIFKIHAQDPPEPLNAFSVMGIPRAENLAELNAIITPNPNIGSVAYNDADGKIYVYINDTDRWVTSDTDNQNSIEVPLSTNINVNGTTVAAADLETNVQEVIEAITPITSKAGRVFYPPSIEIDASTTGAKPDIDLYQEYLDQFQAIPANMRSTGAPADIPTYNRDELYYYVTFADPSVFGTSITIDADGMMSYSIVNTPIDFNTLINVVFVVR